MFAACAFFRPASESLAMNLLESSAYLFIGILCFFVGIALGAGVGAIFLRLAAYVLRLRDIPFPAAFRSTLIANGTLTVIQFMVGVNQGLVMGSLQRRGGMYPGGWDDSRVLGMMFTPTYMLMAMVVGLLFAALVYQKTLPKDKEGNSLSFSDALVLAGVQAALSIVSLVLIGVAVLATIALFLEMPGF